MKIALVVPGGVDRSGEYRVIPALLALIKRLARQHEVHVYALFQERAAAEWDLLGARIHNIGARFTHPRALMAILREHRRGRFHVTHSIWAGGCGSVAVLAAKILRIPSLVHVAGGELVSLPEIGYGGGLRWQQRLRDSLTLRIASVVTAASEPILEQIAAVGVVARRVPLGVDLDAWPAREPTRRAAGSRAQLVHVASLNRVKDQGTLLRALALLAEKGIDFHVDIVGEDTLNGEVQALARQLGLASRTTFHGFQPHRQMRALIEAAHVNVISSRHEAGPLVVLEAAVAGVPSVGTAVGHIAEWAPDAAIKAAVGDAAGLAAGIERLLADEELRLKIAREGLQRARAEHADDTAARFQELYATLTGL